jgi:hypothetical protein
MKQYHITRIEPLNDHRLRLSFDDGTEGIIDFNDRIRIGGIFAKLADADFFSHAIISNDSRYIQWTDEIDFCADALHEEARMATLRPMVA